MSGLPEDLLHAWAEAWLAVCPIAAFALDRDSRIVAANGALAARCGRPVGELIGRALVDLPDVVTELAPLRAGGELVGYAGYAIDPEAARPAELRALNARLQAVREDERAHVASEVHDVLGQALTGLRMDLDWLSRRLPATGRDEVAERLAAMTNLIEGTLLDVRRISRALRPGVLDDLGLVAAVEWQAREFESRAEIPVNLHAPDELELDRERATGLFRILQELLTNVARHANAREVWIALHRAGDSVRLEVRDDGRGIAGGLERLTSLGIPLIRERAGYLGGAVTFAPREGGGTVVTVTIPAAPASPAAPGSP
jgi:signal transduction histidine kinase